MRRERSTRARRFDSSVDGLWSRAERGGVGDTEALGQLKVEANSAVPEYVMADWARQSGSVNWNSVQSRSNDRL